MRMMATIFRDMIRTGKCTIYMDDIVFCGKTKEELHANTLEGLHILETHDLYVKESKCYWEVEEVPVLGHIVATDKCAWRKQKSKLSWSGAHPNQRTTSTSGMGFAIFTADTSKGTPASPSH
jgi:hypothetical protein